jgi:hypothetical protein
MITKKINVVKLNQMLRSGKSVSECASYFKVSSSAVSQAKKNLNVAVVKNVALENAHRVVDKSLNAIDQLQKINGYANDLLELLMQSGRGDGSALETLESKITGNDPDGEIRLKDRHEIALKAMAEIRGQLKLQLEIFQTLYDMKAVQEFQKEVLTAIGEESSDVRDRIVKRLCEKQAIRRVVKFDQQTI